MQCVTTRINFFMILIKVNMSQHYQVVVIIISYATIHPQHLARADLTLLRGGVPLEGGGGGGANGVWSSR